MIKRYIKSRWDNFARSYESVPAHGISEKERIVLKSALSVVFKDKRRVLDVGCGTGFLSTILAELGFEVFAIDISKEMLKIAKSKAKGLYITFESGDAEALPFRDKTFDAVVERHVLWTLTNPEKAIEEWVRVLKDDGVLVLIESEGKKDVAKHHYSEDVASALPFGRGFDLEKFGRIAKRFKLRYDVTKLPCERINTMIVCKKRNHS